MKQSLGGFQKQSLFHPQRCGTQLSHQCVTIHRALSPRRAYLSFSMQSFDWGRGFTGVSDCKESACNARRPRFDPWVRKMLWRREWLPTPVFLPRESHGQRSVEGLQSLGSQRVGHDWATNTSVLCGQDWLNHWPCSWTQSPAYLLSPETGLIPTLWLKIPTL